MKITLEQSAPDFSLYDTEKKKISLSSLRGNNVLLLFFPQAFTGVCTKELCSIRDNIGFYEHTHAKVLGISVDSVFTLAKYKEEQQYNFPLLSDFNKEVSEQYGSLYTDWILDMKGVSKRSAFLIDKNGLVKYAEVLENAGELPDFNTIEQILKGLD
ncbi:MAG: redoxin domain-containing protein [Terrimonas sp.]|nr:redoxin domain-containing protein [Terrimonas sp.]